MNARRILLPLLAAALAVFALGRDARAQSTPSDLTGTWSGKASCKVSFAEDGSVRKARVKDLTLYIRRVTEGPNGAEYAVDFGGDAYSARSVDIGGTGSGKGVAVFALCGSSADTWTGQTELWKMDFKVDPAKDKGKLHGDVLLNDTDDAASPVTGGSAECTATWKRIDMNEPNAAGCE